MSMSTCVRLKVWDNDVSDKLFCIDCASWRAVCAWHLATEQRGHHEHGV
jgi:hypothetical protein